jgi:hypothetical protein
MIASLVAFLALEVGLADAVPTIDEEKALSIAIVVRTNSTGTAVLPHGDIFEVGITNNSARPLKIWEEKCQPGNRTLTFWVKSGDGDASIAGKGDVPTDVWIRQLGRRIGKGRFRCIGRSE